ERRQAFARRAAANACWKGPGKATGDVVEHLRWHPSTPAPQHPGQWSPLGLERGPCRLLLVEPQRLVAFLPGGASLGQQVMQVMMVAPTDLLQQLGEEALLLLVGEPARLARLTHMLTLE